ncbi:XRE family transcriptional regulator [Halomonas sp. YLGW01]|uniref:helix-turn-helix domain-containing protein n=1 Tax=Halomonas sp. YLGW01 TaxID=2773308 RepID=UPI00178564C8|nr:XRE family transcriptional regulator [Halomonas sp. YLGW01]
MSSILHNGAGEENSRPDVLVHVAANVRRLRQAAGLSQQALAEAAGVSRRMLVSVERGDVNVSLATLDRLAEALGVIFHVLVQPPETEDSAHIDEIAWAGHSPQSHGRLLASKAAREVELWRWQLAPGERYDSEADPAGWHEMIVVVEGTLTLRIGEQVLTLAEGEFHVYPSDQAYAYCNEGEVPVGFIRNVLH